MVPDGRRRGDDEAFYGLSDDEVRLIIRALERVGVNRGDVYYRLAGKLRSMAAVADGVRTQAFDADRIPVFAMSVERWDRVRKSVISALARWEREDAAMGGKGSIYDDVAWAMNNDLRQHLLIDDLVQEPADDGLQLPRVRVVDSARPGGG